jgi:hypothetical protein
VVEVVLVELLELEVLAVVVQAGFLQQEQQAQLIEVVVAVVDVML